MTKQPRSFHAVVIGIDKYPSPSIGQLAGAVADAKAMEEYLKTRMGVLQNQIRVLHDHEATREAILDALKAITTNPQIGKDDRILIYYAGHGATAACPPRWNSTGSEIQLILPYDCDLKTVSGIPDRTIAVLLNKIAKAKGDNITVIFDCCHSGSGTREIKRLARGIQGTVEIPPELDQEIWGASSGGRKALIPGGFLQKGMRSHVLLAACSAKEMAMEKNNRGVFTTALIQKLETTRADKITYAELIRQIGKLEDGRQNPQCEGENRGHLLFNAKTDRSRIRQYGVEKVNGQYILAAGTMHGIFEGSRFDIYDQSSGTSMPVGILTASKPGTVTTIMNLATDCPPFEINERTLAVQHSHGNIPFQIYVEGKELRHMLQYCVEELGMNISHKAKDPNTILSVALETGDLIFRILDKRMTAHGLDRIPLSIPFNSPPSHDVLERFKRVLLSAVHYSHHLRQEFSSKILTDKAKVEFIQLEGDEEDENGLQPVGPDLIKKREIDIVDDKESNYGFKITNKSRYPLYPSVFFFASDLSVQCFYHPGMSGGVTDVPLPPGETLIVGSGAAGGDPITFNLDPTKGDYDEGFNRMNLDTDVGLFKIYLSNIPVDVEDVLQNSPFEPIDPKKNERQPKRKDRYKPSDNIVEIWETITIPLIERRYLMSEKTSSRASLSINNRIGASAFLLLAGSYIAYRFYPY